jgi:predicted NBD/HSP70 family sugar kinase
MIWREMSLPTHVPEQIALYQGEYLLTHEVCSFDPALAADILRSSRQEVIAIDVGGDKVRRATYAIRHGVLTRLDEETLRSRGGEGYLSFLEHVAEEAVARDLRIGVSSATKLDGSRIARTVNLPVFFEELGRKYDADYENLFPGRSFVANDTIAGICGSCTHLALQGRAIRDAAFFICGSGLGASVIKDGAATHVEAAHVPLVDRLNPLGQAMRCNVPGHDFVCLERVTAARAGIENLYFQLAGEARDGVALGRMYEEDDALATRLYQSSARALAHATVGVMERYAFFDSPGNVVVFHGGNFEIERYRTDVGRSLQGLPGPHAQVVFSRDLSGNVCLDGAAVMALYFEKHPHPHIGS